MDAITNCAIFSADFPDDAQWNDSGDLIVPGGNAIAMCLVDSLTAKGFNAAAKQHSYYAWLISVKVCEFRLECYLHDLQPWLLIIEAKGGLFNKRGRMEFLQKMVANLKEIIISERRFRNVEWTTRQKLEADARLKRK